MMIEKEFTIVLYADVKVQDKKREYYLKLNTDGKDSAKCPPAFIMEGYESIPNDSNIFLQHIRTILSNNK